MRPANQAEIDIVQAPCNIRLKHRDLEFVVEDADAWGYTEFGIMATGHWLGSNAEHTLHIPTESILYIEPDFYALAQAEEFDDASAS